MHAVALLGVRHRISQVELISIISHRTKETLFRVRQKQGVEFAIFVYVLIPEQGGTEWISDFVMLLIH